MCSLLILARYYCEIYELLLQHSPPSIFLQLVTSKRLGFLIEALLLLHRALRLPFLLHRRYAFSDLFSARFSLRCNLLSSLFLSLSLSPFRLCFLQCPLEHDSGRWLDLTSSSSSAKPLSLPTYRLPFFFILARWPCEGRVNEQYYERERKRKKEKEREGT